MICSLFANENAKKNSKNFHLKNSSRKDDRAETYVLALGEARKGGAALTRRYAPIVHF